MSTFFEQLSFVKAFLRALPFSALCFCVCCNASAKNVYKRGLRYQIPGQTLSNCPVVEWRYYYANQPNGNLTLWPELGQMNSHYQSANGITWYFPYPYTFETAPFFYVPTDATSAGTVPDSWTNDDLKAVNDAMKLLPQQQQAAITGFKGFNTNTESPFIKDYEFTYRSPGTQYGGGLIVLNQYGTPEWSYLNAQGYIPGYVSSGPGTYKPVYYDMSSGSPVVLDSLPASQTLLQYDSDTGQYSFSAPDYSPILQDISYKIDNIELRPEINVNPQVEVNPTVTVPAPEVTVNVPAPEVTVNPTVTVPAPEVTVNVTNSNGSSNLLQDANYTDPGFNPQVPEWTQEESELNTIMSGWQTSVPGIGDQLDGALNVVVGRIPTFGSSLNLGTIEAGPYTVALDWSRYATIIAWIRAACLFVLVILFGIAVWNTVTQSLQV